MSNKTKSVISWTSALISATGAAWLTGKDADYWPLAIFVVLLLAFSLLMLTSIKRKKI